MVSPRWLWKMRPSKLYNNYYANNNIIIVANGLCMTCQISRKCVYVELITLPLYLPKAIPGIPGFRGYNIISYTHHGISFKLNWFGGLNTYKIIIKVNVQLD